MGFLTSEQLEGLLESQRGAHLPLGQVLASLGFLSPETLDEELRLYLSSRSA
jgi:hypothetical protein